MLSRAVLRALLGARLPQHEGELKLKGVRGPIRIARDAYGIPYIEASSDEDAWFAQGFCQGQDRCFQLEALARVARGRISELFGPETLGIDRLARRVGFHRHAKLQLQGLDPDIRHMLESFAAGVTAGKKKGCPRPHEFTLLMRRRTPFLAEDTLGILGVMSFLLASNWDAELTRLEVLERDGPEALAAIDRPYPEWLTTAAASGESAGIDPSAVALLGEARELGALLGLAGGGSNNWVISPSRTRSGRPILANDPHLGPLCPPQWYLSSISAPGWRLAGAAFAGTPGISSGHNGHVAWGITAGMVDTTDLFIEEIGPGGNTVREGDRLVPCDVLHEKIRVRGPWGHRTVEEDIPVTPRGPVLGSAIAGRRTLSIKATWLEGLPLRGILDLKGVKNFEEFRAAFTKWPSLTLNFVYADREGHIGWQLTGLPPIRKAGSGAIPAPGWDARFGWSGIAETSDLPWLKDPSEGFIATANAKPATASRADIGSDFLDGYRMARIQQALAGREDWDLPSTRKLQLDQKSLVWAEIRGAVMGALATAPSSAERELLERWDGVLSADSQAGSIYELLLHELIRRAATARAPRSADVLLGSTFVPGLIDHPLYSFRRHGWIVRLIRQKPEGWFAQGWDQEIREAFAAGCVRLRREHGEDPGAWGWGKLRPLEIRHALGQVPVLRPVFNLGPVPWGGDTNTVAQATNGTLNPFSNPGAISNLRTSIDVGEWDESRFVLA
ncbi:MAG TPA: penicillin acylase family protein, partial [Bdellovibrionota bacterium]|nr:penicillin acylase family protein [Bdellovibrionota bacterium]